MRDVLRAIRRRAVAQPRAVALVDGPVALDYAQLMAEIAAAAAWAQLLPERVGLIGPKGREWVIAELALTSAGKTLVPLPEFFSFEQLHHILADAGLEYIVFTASEFVPLVTRLGVPTSPLGRAEPIAGNCHAAAARRLVYTSGSTGTPKGVRLGARQLTASITGLRQAVTPSPADRYLSVLPFALLLEQIAGIYLPLTAGASIHLALGAVEALATGTPSRLLDEVARAKPTVTMLVPDHLEQWVAAALAFKRAPPASLRFVAVGGAPILPALAQAAWAIGIPVHEGYGLTEGCSVVSVNRPGERKEGTVGTPLPGVEIAIDKGEIVVSGPTIMSGYRGGPSVGRVWRTGDLGEIDDSGRLIVHGRRDDLIVTTTGRNLRPEWIEAMIRADARIRLCVITDGGRLPCAILVPAPGMESWFAASDTASILALLHELCREAPSYARPASYRVMRLGELLAHGLVTADFRPRRKALAAYTTQAYPAFAAAR